VATSRTRPFPQGTRCQISVLFPIERIFLIRRRDVRMWQTFQGWSLSMRETLWDYIVTSPVIHLTTIIDLLVYTICNLNMASPTCSILNFKIIRCKQSSHRVQESELLQLTKGDRLELKAERFIKISNLSKTGQESPH